MLAIELIEDDKLDLDWNLLRGFAKRSLLRPSASKFLEQMDFWDDERWERCGRDGDWEGKVEKHRKQVLKS